MWLYFRVYITRHHQKAFCRFVDKQRLARVSMCHADTESRNLTDLGEIGGLSVEDGAVVIAARLIVIKIILYNY